MSGHDEPTLFDPLPKVCPTCARPWRQLDERERARSGDHPGVEHRAASLTDNAKLSKACAAALGALPVGVWVPAAKLREWPGVGADGPRRVRQLRDEYGYPIRVEMRSAPRQAWYMRTGGSLLGTDLPG